jgi:RHS repeat-associated protein
MLVQLAAGIAVIVYAGQLDRFRIGRVASTAVETKFQNLVDTAWQECYNTSSVVKLMNGCTCPGTCSCTQGPVGSQRAMTMAYNAQGYLSEVTDPLNRATTYTYDLAGRVTQETLPDGRQINYTYDANGNLTSLTPPGRPAHQFTYTPLNFTEDYIAPNVGAGTTTNYLYNLDKQLIRVTRPDAQMLNLNYDTAGRLSTMTTPRGTSTYAYYPTTGNLSGITAPGGVGLSFTYDGALPLSSVWSGPVSGSVANAFDDNFRVVSMNVNGANPVAFGYDNDGLLTSAGSLAIARNAGNGLPIGTTLGNVTDALTYNSFAEMQSYTAAVGGAAVFDVQYARDALGRITRKVETIGGVTHTYDYTYDAADRLAEVDEDGVTTAAYFYDANGNRLSRSAGGVSTIGTYDEQDRLLNYGGNSYAYTANGELLTKTSGGQTTAYDYDLLGNLMSVALPDGTDIRYIVDGQNRRIGKKVNGTLTQGFLYDGQIQIVAELDGSNNVVSRFVYGTKGNVPDYMIRGGVTYRIISDSLGSPRVVIDTTTGTIAQQLDYDEFGNIVFDTNPGFQPFGFAGGLYDHHTKLTRFGARDYDAETGRWTSKDPILFLAGDTNLYGYVFNDPVNWIDPWGLSCHGDAWLGKLQIGLDIAGLIPGIGEGFDLANAGIAWTRGDKVSAGLSAGAAIPFVGWGATVGKFGNKLLKNEKLIRSATKSLNKERKLLKSVAGSAPDPNDYKNWSKIRKVKKAIADFFGELFGDIEDLGR